MTWDAYIVLAVQKDKNLSDILVKNGFPRDDSLIFRNTMEVTKIFTENKNLQVKDLLDEFNIFEGSHIMALTGGDLGVAEDIKDNMFTEYLFNEFYGLQGSREMIFDGDIIVLYMYDFLS